MGDKSLVSICDDCGWGDGGHAPTCPRWVTMNGFQVLPKGPSKEEMERVAGDNAWRRGVFEQLVAERDQLKALAKATRDTLTVIHEWLGMASTREVAIDSMRRLERLLSAAGFEYTWKGILDWRGSIIEELWQARFYAGPDDHWHYVPGDPPPVFGNAKGPELAQIVGLLERASADAARYHKALMFIQEMASEDLRLGFEKGSIYQIEAEARAALHPEPPNAQA